MVASTRRMWYHGVVFDELDEVVPEYGVVGDADSEREGDAGEHCQPGRRSKVVTERPAPHGTSIVSSAMAEHSTIKT